MMLRMFFLMAVLSCIYAQSITVKDIIFLVDLGIGEAEIIRHIQNSEVDTFSSEDINLLKQKGVSQRIIDSLTTHEPLSALGILQALKNGKTTEEIEKTIMDASNIKDYSIKDWLILYRKKVSPKIIDALKAKLTSGKVTIEDIKSWHDAGEKSSEIIKRLQASEIDAASINSRVLLQLKKDGYPKDLILFLAELHLNPENKKTAEIDEPKKQEKTDKKQSEPSQPLVSPKSNEIYVKLYPQASHIPLPKREENIISKIPRAFYCSLFSIADSLDEIEEFYKKEYDDVQVARINFNEIVHILRMKFLVPGCSDFMEVRCYSIDEKKFVHMQNIEEIEKNIARNDYALKKIITEMETQKHLNEIGNISLEERNKRLSKLQAKLNIILNTKTYWDHEVIKHVFEKKQNMLLVVQPTNIVITTRAKESLVDRISSVKARPSKSKTLAKDYPLVVFPRSNLISHDKMHEGLKRTSKARSIYRSQFLCSASTDEVEGYYRKYFENASVWRIEYLDSFLIVKAKFEIPEIRSQVEVAFYALNIGPSSVRFASRKKRVKDRLRQLERSVRNIDNEINALQDLLTRKKISADNAKLRINKLKQKKHLKLNASSYWDFIVMDKVMTSQKSILLLKEIKRHF